ncbi:class I SAM-dependent methyltransferase [Paenibacillus hamazuiensis]|uniref:class I SAM-dependent methyltransferase n=1 Tax=Paenibacillus hamazuiensis TaxID=2936508 RepID=UPI00200E4391|nr:class I SAM-dependent methyltransferase [Paenibacillus hamazuiensis]
MIPDGNLKSNIERFSGFEEVYDKFRPQAPKLVVELLTGYLQSKPSVVMDLGCGTGLSSFIWKDRADRVIGVEPNDDMRSKALQKLQMTSNADHIAFIPGYSNQLEADSETADIITCSQSFHWMEPASTLKEVQRVLKRGGIFAAYDCDWPPTVNWEIELQYTSLIEKADTIIERLADQDKKANKWNKDHHLRRMAESGVFRFTKEIVFHNFESCDAERYAGLAFSQGGVQTVLKLGSDELNPDIEKFRASVENHFQGRTLDVMFSYRLRLGVK